MNTQNKVQKNVVVTETKVALNITNSEAIAIAKAAQAAKPTYKAAKVIAFDAADTVLIEQFKKNRAFLIVKHTSKVAVEAEVEQSVAPSVAVNLCLPVLEKPKFILLVPTMPKQNMLFCRASLFFLALNMK